MYDYNTTVNPYTGRLQLVTPPGGVTKFIDLTDVPHSYTGQTGKAAIVNATEDGLIFSTISGTDEKVKNTASDTTAGYLSGTGAKIVAGPNITLTTLNPGGNEQLQIEAGMVYPGAGIAVSTGSAWATSITGTSSQFVKADGSLDTTTYLPTGTTLDNVADGSTRFAIPTALTTDNLPQGSTNLYFGGGTLDSITDGSTYTKAMIGLGGSSLQPGDVGVTVLAQRTFGSAANNDTGDFATSAQGSLADTALQSIPNTYVTSTDASQNIPAISGNDGKVLGLTSGSLSWVTGGGGGSGLGGVAATVVTFGSTSTLDTTLGFEYELDLTGNTTMAFTGAHSDGKTFSLLLCQDATGSRTITWPSDVVWSNDTIPTLTTTPLHADYILFYDNGTKWLATLVAQHLACDLPPVPTSLATTPISTTQINLAWDVMGGAASYNVYRDSVFITNVSTAYYNDTGLTPSTTYAYQVSSVNGYGESALCTAVNGTTMTPVTSPNWALQFDGSTNYVDIPDFTGVGTDWTIEFWAKSSTTGTIMKPVTWNIGNAAGDMIYFHSNGGVYFIAGGTSDAPYLDGNWHHYAGTVSGGSLLTLYIDGTNVWSGSYSVGDLSSLIGDFVIGANANNGREFFNGTIDEIRISDTVRYTTTFTPAHSWGGDSNTVAHYAMNEGTGITLADSSGNGHTGTLTTTGSVLPIWVTGVSLTYDSGLVFDGSNYVTVSHDSALNPSTGTVEAWVKLDSSNYGSDREIAATRGNPFSGGWELQTDPSGNVGFGFTGTNGWQDNAYSSGINAYDGQWHHIAAVIDGVSTYVYFDGQQVGSQSGSGSLLDVDNPLTIGRRSDGYGAWSGTIDEVRISDTARYTTTFIPATSYAVDSNTVAYYKMNENYGTTMVTDISGNGHDGTQVGTPTPEWYMGVTETDYSLEFSGGNYAAIPNNVAFYPQGNFTIETYYKSAGSGTAYIIGNWNNTNGFFIAPITNEVFFQANFTSQGTAYKTFNFTADPNDGNWHHIAIVYDGSTITCSLDGVFSSDTLSLGTDTFSIGANSLYLGGAGNGTLSPCTLDETRFSNIVRYPTNTTFTPATYFNTDDNTTALYHYNEGSGTILSDASANGNEGVLTGTPTWSTGVTV